MKTRCLLLGVTALLLFLSFRFLLPLVLPFALAYFFAKMVSPIIHFLTQKLKWHKKVSAVMVVVIVVAAVGGFTLYTISIVLGQSILLLQKLPVYQQWFGRTIEQVCCHCDDMLELAGGTSYHYVETQAESIYRNIGQEILPKLSVYAVGIFQWIGKAGGSVFIFILSTLLILLDDSFPKIHRTIRPFVTKLKTAGFAYIKAQSIIIFIIAVVLSVGLMLMGNDYAVLFGIGIAVFDAFPVVGSGLVLVPWAFLMIIGGNYYNAAILFTIFAIASFLREILEPRLFGKETGLKPLFVLISVYVGVQLFSIGGIILGPVGLAILKVVDEMVQERMA